MYIDAPDKTAPLTVAPLLTFSILLCVLGVVGMGLYPKPFVMAALPPAAPPF